MAHADWDPVVLDRRGRRTTGESKEAAMARAVRTGVAVSERKMDAATNKSAATGGAGTGARALEEDSEHFGGPATVAHSLSLAIQQARLAKKLTQKELATLIAEKPTVIGDYEAGRASPNPAILVKLDRALGVHLPRPAKKK